MTDNRSSADSKYARLPCPFCGHEPYAAMDMKGAIIQCQNPDCFGPRTTAAYLVHAVQQWNKRASITDPAQPTLSQLSELPDYLDYLEQSLVDLDIDLKLPENMQSPSVWADRVRSALAAQPPAAPAPLMDAGSMFTFLRERMKDDTSASLIVACRALHDHLRVQAAPAAPVDPIDVFEARRRGVLMGRHVKEALKEASQQEATAPVEPPSSIETCRDCGAGKPCDEDCPNYVEPRSVQCSSAGNAGVIRLLTRIADLVDDEDAGEPLDDAIRWANEALALLNEPQTVQTYFVREEDQKNRHMKLSGMEAWGECWSVIHSPSGNVDGDDAIWCGFFIDRHAAEAAALALTRPHQRGGE